MTEQRLRELTRQAAAMVREESVTSDRQTGAWKLERRDAWLSPAIAVVLRELIDMETDKEAVRRQAANDRGDMSGPLDPTIF